MKSNDVQMKRVKFSFATLIIVIAIALSSTVLLYMQLAQSQIVSKDRFDIVRHLSLEIKHGDEISNGLSKYYLPDYSKCTIKPPKKRIIILRMDDLGRPAYYNIIDLMIKEIEKRDLSIVLGVIPEDIKNDNKFLSWADDLAFNPNFEFALHGFSHSLNEFSNLSKSDSLNLISKGVESMKTNLKVNPVTFIPPYNVYSNGTIESLKYAGFKIISAKQDEYSINNNLSFLGYNGKTFEFGSESYFIPYTEVSRECGKSLDDHNVCIIMLHPQDYLVKDSTGKNTKVIDKAKYRQFIGLLDNLQTLKAEFKTFKDLLVCN